MSLRRLLSRKVPRPLAALAICTAAGLTWAGGLLVDRQPQVGGVYISADGILNNAEVDDTQRMREFRQKALQAQSEDIQQKAPLRMISLRKLEEAIQQKLKDFQPLPDEIKYLAGLQRVQYVLVYPERKDIVLAGPAEGWKINDSGNVVGVTTGMPVLHLDDLLVALRSADRARNGGISCSIDPTQEGLSRLQSFLDANRNFSPQTVAGMEQALGAQKITVEGVPDTSRFAQVMVAADYRMKRLAMNFDKSPVRELPSFMALMPANTRKLEMPRWWMAPKYDPLLKDAEGLAFQLRGQGVQTMTEQEYLGEDGQKKKAAAAPGTPARKWADLMTAHYTELAAKEAVFGDLRNCMDLAIVGALIQREDLRGKSGFPMTLLLDADGKLMIDQFHVARQVGSKASVLKKGRNWLVSVSGGVEIQPWEIAQQTQVSQEVVPVYKQASSVEPTNWWWN